MRGGKKSSSWNIHLGGLDRAEISDDEMALMEDTGESNSRRVVEMAWNGFRLISRLVDTKANGDGISCLITENTVSGENTNVMTLDDIPDLWSLI